MDDKLIYKDLSYKINGILFAVHNELGRFKNEKQYSDKIEEYLKKLKIVYEREKILPSSIKQEIIGKDRVDFIVDNKIVLEVKAKSFLNKEDYYQVRRYLSIINRKLGILVNFRARYIVPKRILNSQASE
mgnify:FL=1